MKSPELERSEPFLFRAAKNAAADGSRRILHVIPSMNPRWGGPPEGLRQLLPHYRALGDQVEVASLDAPDDPSLQTLPVPVHAFGPVANWYGMSRPLFRWLRSNVDRFDLVVVNGVWQFHCVAAWRACRRAGVPYVVFTHGMLDVYFRRRYPLKHVKKMMYWPMQYQVLRRAQAVLFTSEAERELSAASFKPNKWAGQVVPYGTNKPGGDAGAQVAALEGKVPAVAGKRFLLFLSRIHQKKGCDLLLAAFAKVARYDRELELVVAGPDPVGLEEQLKAQARALGIADRVHWPGMLAGAEKVGALRAAEALVLPSHQENFGIVVAEALAVGTPVLISDQINIWKEVVHDEVGLVEADTLEGTTELLRRWLATPAEERRKMGTRAVTTFERRYSMVRAAERLHSLAMSRAPMPARVEQLPAAG